MNLKLILLEDLMLLEEEKESTARVWVKRGTGKILINGKEMISYFARPVLQMQLNFVFDVTERKDQFDVIATVKGGGLSGQAGAVRAWFK